MHRTAHARCTASHDQRCVLLMQSMLQEKAQEVSQLWSRVQHLEADGCKGRLMSSSINSNRKENVAMALASMDLSVDDLLQLKRDMIEQEVLLRAYQQENESASKRIKVRAQLQAQLTSTLRKFNSPTCHATAFAIELCLPPSQVALENTWVNQPTVLRIQQTLLILSTCLSQELEQALTQSRGAVADEAARLERHWMALQEEGRATGAEAAARLQRILELENAVEGLKDASEAKERELRGVIDKLRREKREAEARLAGVDLKAMQVRRVIALAAMSACLSMLKPSTEPWHTISLLLTAVPQACFCCQKYTEPCVLVICKLRCVSPLPVCCK